MSKPTADVVVQAVQAAVKKHRHLDAPADSDLESLHLDYFDAVDLLIDVENQLGISIKDAVEDVIKPELTIQQLAESIVSNL